MSDDIIADDLFEELEIDKEDKPESENWGDGTSSTSTEDEILVEADTTTPQLVGTDFPVEYKMIVNRFLDLYQDLPVLKYNEIYAELAQLAVDSSPTPTLQLINLKLQKIQRL